MPSPCRVVRWFPLSFVVLALGVLTACSSAREPAADTADDGGVGSAEQAVTAQPDPSCKYARFGVHDYWMCTTARNFNAAKAMCEGVGMTLARIDNSAENDFVKAEVGGDSWIGATDSASEGVWRWNFENAQFWSGNRPGSPVGGLFNKWTSVEPNDLFGEDCGMLVKNTGEWNDIACTLTRSFVCESSPATGGQPQAPDTACTLSTRNGATYWTCSNTRSWDNARANCQSAGADLVTIDDSAEASFLAPSLTRETYIGLNDKEQEGTWRWSATRRPAFCGTSGGRTPYGSYSNWASGQPIRSNTCQKVDSGNRTYWICSNETTWDVARDQCAGTPGMSLARIDSAAENALIAGKITKDSWLGGSDRAAETQWRWLDNTQFWNGHDNGTPVGGRYTNFQVGEPNDLFGENCLVMYMGGKWNDTLCDAPLGGIGFACEGSKDAGPPDRNDCAFAKSGGTWSAADCVTPRAYICESVPADASQKLEDITSKITQDHTSGGPRVTGFEVKAGTVIKEPFVGREERLGLRACDDSLEPSGTPELLSHLNLERVNYDQKYGGVKVYGRGYTVLRNPTTKNVTSVMGELAPELSVATTPAFTESQALTRAATAIGRVPGDFSPTPRGELVVYPKVMGKKPVWELSWMFNLRRTTGNIDQSVVVSAISGNVIQSSPQSRACNNTTVPSPAPQQLITVNAPQGIQYGDPAQALMTVTTSSTLPTHLYASGTPGSAQTPIISAACNGAGFPNVMRMARGPIDYNSSGAGPTDDETGAAMFLATQTSLNAFTGLFSLQGLPWLGVDRAGARQIELDIRPGRSVFDTIRNADGTWKGVIRFDTRRTGDGARLDLAGHELGHYVWRSFVDTSVDSDLESRAVNEGLAEVMGAAVETQVRAGRVAETGAFCGGGDEFKNLNVSCLVNFMQPLASSMDGCRLSDSQGRTFRAGCPMAYWDQDYCKAEKNCGLDGPITTECCDDHTNGTVFAHWLYLVSMGSSAAINSAACTYTVQKIHPDPNEAIKIASRVVHKALTDRKWKNVQYKGLSDATIQAAIDMGLTADQVQSVRSAWYAVNVREKSFESTVKLMPERGAKKVHPWVTFTWAAGPGETDWDFQLDNADFQNAQPLYETRVQNYFGNPAMAYTAVALPENSTSHYVWRVRPHTTQPWSDCYAINWFDDTGPMTQPPVSVGNLDALTGLLQVGTRFVYFPHTPGVPGWWDTRIGQLVYPALSGYNVQFSTSNKSCIKDAETVVVPIQPTETPINVVPFAGTQPGASYWANVQPLGPPQIGDKKPALGPCVTVTATSGPPNMPLILQPANGQRFNLYPPHERDPETPGMLSKLELDWTVDSWMVSSRVRFQKQLPDGSCGDVVGNDITLSTPATCTSGCMMSITEDLFPNPYPGGYCWTVTGIGAPPGNVETPPVTGKWTYVVNLNLTTERSPGVPTASGLTDALDVDFGAKVPLSWGQVPSATEYYVKVWNFTSAYGDEQLGNPLAWEATVGGGATTTEVPGNAQRSGRYCWELTPKLGDPVGGGTAAGQPTVNAGGPICYTTKPAKPRIFIDAKPPATGFSSKAPVTGRVEFDYIPDEQYLANAGQGWNWDQTTQPWCQTFNQVFKDIVKCTRKFTIPPVEDKKIEINIKAFNLPGAPGRKPTDEDDPVHEVTDGFKFGNCGGANQPCCTDDPNKKCDDAKLMCNASKICTPMECGMTDGDCCPLPNQCKSAQDKCDAGKCRTKPPMCGDTLQAGGNNASQRDINLIAIKGITRLTINTFEVPDNLVVSYAGDEVVNTGCVFTGKTIDGCADSLLGLGGYPGCSLDSPTLVKGCWCCKSGSCYTDVQYSGKTSVFTVDVNPSCDGKGDNTEWNYSLSCPK